MEPPRTSEKPETCDACKAINTYLEVFVEQVIDYLTKNTEADQMDAATAVGHIHKALLKFVARKMLFSYGLSVPSIVQIWLSAVGQVSNLDITPIAMVQSTGAPEMKH